MSDSFLPSTSSQPEYLHSGTKLFHAQRTSGEKPFSALERSVLIQANLHPVKNTNIKVIRGFSLGRVSPVKQLVSKLQTECNLKNQRQSFQGLQQRGLYIKTVGWAASPAPCWSISLLLASAAHQNSPVRGMNFPSTFISQWATETSPTSKEHRWSLHKEATCLCLPVKSSGRTSTELKL